MNLSLQKKSRGLFDGSLITTSGTPLAQLRTESVVSRDVIYLACCSGNPSHTLVQWTGSSTVLNLSIVAIYNIEPIETIETKLRVSENKINNTISKHCTSLTNT